MGVFQPPSMSGAPTLRPHSILPALTILFDHSCTHNFINIWFSEFEPAVISNQRLMLLICLLRSLSWAHHFGSWLSLTLWPTRHVKLLTLHWPPWCVRAFYKTFTSHLQKNTGKRNTVFYMETYQTFQKLMCFLE